MAHWRALFALTLLAAVSLGCGPSAPARPPLTAGNDWPDRVVLHEDSKFSFGGKVYTRRRYVVADGGPLSCKDEQTRKFWPYTEMCGKPRALVDGRLILHAAKPTFFFDELLEGERVVAELAPRRIQLVAGKGIFLETVLSQLREHAVTTYSYGARSGVGKVYDEGADKYWSHEGDFGKGRATHKFEKYARFDPGTGKAVPSDVLVVQPIGKKGELAVVTDSSGSYALEIFEGDGVRVGLYPDYLPRAGSRTGLVSLGPKDLLITVKDRKGGRGRDGDGDGDGDEEEYDLLLDENLLPKGSPPGRVLVTGSNGFVALRGSNLFWPLGDREVPADVVGVIPRDATGNPIPFAYSVWPTSSFFVKYADSRPVRWALADASLTKVTPPMWRNIAWSPALDPKNPSLYTWKHPLLVAEMPDGTWTAYQQTWAPANQTRDRSEPLPVGSGRSFDEAVAAATVKYAGELAAHRKLIKENEERDRAFWAAKARSEQAERDARWQNAVRSRNRGQVTWLVSSASDPERWLQYADVMGADASVSSLVDAEKREADPSRKARLQSAIQRVREAQAAAAKRAAALEAARLQAQRPQAPAASGGSWSPTPVKVDTSGYENLVKENFARSQSGQNPWGRSCWGSGC